MTVRLLGMDLHCAHIEAHRLEHGITRDLEAKLMERLDYPQKSPFGQPIPGTGAPQFPPNCVTLDAVTTDMPSVVERRPEEDSNLVRFLANSKITPESAVRVTKSTPYLGIMVVPTRSDQISRGFNIAQ